MKKNEIYRVEIEDLNNLGYGVCHLGGKTVFVKGGVVGDIGEIKIIKTEKTWGAGRLERLITPSPHRVENLCPAKGCGGCAYRDISYSEECRRKQNYVDFCFKKAGVQAEVLPTETGSSVDFYRNKAQYAVGTGKDGGLICGFYAPKSHRITEAPRCMLQEKTFAPIVEAVLAFFTEKKLTAYNEDTGKGLLRHIYLRHSDLEKSNLLTLVLTENSFPGENEFIEEIRGKNLGVSGILINVNRENTNVILGKTYRTLWGEPYLLDEICGVKVKLAPDAFFQVNRPAAELLYTRAKELSGLTGKETLWDLYCGVGSIGLSMARDCRRLVGVEIVESAAENARENAKRNGISHAEFVTGDAGSPEKLLAGALKTSGKPDTVILDPPRKGCDEALLRYLAGLGVQRIVYISCGPDTLARDASRLMALGYRMEKVLPVNLFPRTGHVEAVTAFTRTTKEKE